jgi:hypothetical protein
MIPRFNDNGYLPPGIHKASLDEIADRFGWQSETRVAGMESIRWLVDLVRGTEIERIIINGSFVTAIHEPNDVDCVLLVNDALFKNPALDAALEDGFPFLEIDVVDRRAFDYYVETFFALDRKDVPKGMIEVIL